MDLKYINIHNIIIGQLPPPPFFAIIVMELVDGTMYLVFQIIMFLCFSVIQKLKEFFPLLMTPPLVSKYDNMPHILKAVFPSSCIYDGSYNSNVGTDGSYNSNVGLILKHTLSFT